MELEFHATQNGETYTIDCLAFNVADDKLFALWKDLRDVLKKHGFDAKMYI